MTVDDLIKSAFQRIEYDNGQVHECYEFLPEEMDIIIKELDRLREYEWMYKDLAE